MKNTKFFFVGVCIGLVFLIFIGATIDYRALNSNQFTTSGIVSLKSGAQTTNLIFYGTSPRFSTDFLPDFDSSAEVGWLQIQADGKFQRTFDGSSLTNLSGSQAVTQFVQNVTFVDVANFLSNISIAGKATFNNNVYLIKLEFSTNAAPTEVIDFARNFYLLRTNNNVVFAEAVNWSTTNHNETIYSFTNSGAAPFTVTMHGTYQNMKAEEGNTLYCTNVGQLLVWGEHGQTGTNFYWRSR